MSEFFLPYFCKMLQVKNISFKYDKIPILSNISFAVKKGEHVSIIGESGSGKSTLLKLLYGAYDVDEGELMWNSHKILGPKHHLVVGSDFMKYVAQEFDLMPYTTVEENVGEFLSNFFPNEKQQRVKELLEIIELSDFAKTKVKLLSGGQKQRVALARAVANDPEIVLLDEPFSHIDNFKKQPLRRRLYKFLKEKEITCIVATHDKDDVLGYSDKIVVLEKTKISALGSQIELFNNPKSNLIAAFFGEFNRLESHGIVYAHQLKVVKNSDIKVTIKKSYFKGQNYLIEALLDTQTVFFEHPSDLKIGKMVFLKVTK